VKASIAAKSILASIVFSLGVVSLRLRKRTKTGFLILMYHRIIPKSEAKKNVQAGMYIDPDTFQTHILFLQKNFRIATISEILINPECNLDNSNKRPVCFLTFDDGWFDFYQYAYPILEEHKISATVFLPTDFIGTDKWFWTDRLATLLKQRESARNLVSRKQPSAYNLVDKLERLSGNYELQLEKAIAILKDYRVKGLKTS
jgi:hypothetical protein